MNVLFKAAAATCSLFFCFAIQQEPSCLLTRSQGMLILGKGCDECIKGQAQKQCDNTTINGCGAAGDNLCLGQCNMNTTCDGTATKTKCISAKRTLYKNLCKCDNTGQIACGQIITFLGDCAVTVNKKNETVCDCPVTVATGNPCTDSAINNIDANCPCPVMLAFSFPKNIDFISLLGAL